MQDRLFTILVEEDNISWKSLIHDLVRSQKMDPWDVNVTLLAQKYIQRVRAMRNMDLNVSGKVVLAAAILLNIKSKKLLGEDLLEFDRLLATPEEEGDFYGDLEQEYALVDEREPEEFPIYPRTPQPRKRKVSVFDLLDALEKALEVKHRRQNRLQTVEISAPEKQVDITVVLKDLFGRILGYFKKQRAVEFSELLQTQSREEKVNTFIPLLYLSNEQKVRLVQDDHFAEIKILPAEGNYADAK